MTRIAPWLRLTAWGCALAAALALDVLEAVLTGRPEGPASRLCEAVGRRTKEAEEAYWRTAPMREGT